MPRRKKIEEIDDEAKVEINYVSPEDVRTQKLLAAIPGGQKCISVFRYPVGLKGGRPSYISDISPDQFNYSTVREMFGGGKFSLEWENANGSITKSILEVEGPRFKFDDETQEKETGKPASTTDEDEGPLIVAQNGRSNPYQGPDNGSVSPLEFYRIMAEERREARKEAREEMQMLIDAIKEKSTPQSPDMTRQVFDLAEKVVGMSSTMGGGDGGSPILAALAMFKEPIQQIVQTIQAAVNRPPMPNPPIQHVHPVQRVQQAPPSPQPQAQEVDVITMLLSRYLPMFVEAASTGEDESIYADMILAKIPESQYTVLQNWLNKPDCLDGLAQINPAIGYQKAWWVRLRELILEGLNDALQPTSTPEQSEQD